LQGVFVAKRRARLVFLVAFAGRHWALLADVARGEGELMGRDESDEACVIGLCDRVLGRTALRQHRFDYLLGDQNRHGTCRKLPVDAFYLSLALVIEYRERQHSEAVPFMDQRTTINGFSRGEQRRRYDERRRVAFSKHGINLVELDFSMFDYDKGSKRLRRNVTAPPAQCSRE
jgi:hypothetical protein